MKVQWQVTFSSEEGSIVGQVRHRSATTAHAVVRLTKPNHPWTTGQVKRMNRTIRGATVKRFHYYSHGQIRTHLAEFMAACTFARRIKTLNGITPDEYICKIWTSEPERFTVDPIHQRPGLNTLSLLRSIKSRARDA